MDQHYYELVVTADKHIELIESFILDLTGEAVERRGDSVILRTETDPTIHQSAIKNQIELLQTIFEESISSAVTIEKKANEDWVQKYKEGFTPFVLGSFYVRATWHEADPARTNIVIDPELSFGTGHHPTTRVCLQAIEKYVNPEARFLDVGCGSGILSIAAAKLGANVSLCDIEAPSIANATTNLKGNGVTPEAIWEGSIQDADGDYDVIVANIVSDILIFLKKDIEKHLKQGGYVILSGILEKYENRVKKSYSSLKLADRIQEGEWISLIYKKEE
jgi:ribosomal protein L11 methyltransferase